MARTASSEEFVMEARIALPGDVFAKAELLARVKAVLDEVEGKVVSLGGTLTHSVKRRGAERAAAAVQPQEA